VDGKIGEIMRDSNRRSTFQKEGEEGGGRKVGVEERVHWTTWWRVWR
jgi:hypothetical protein